MGMTIDKAIDHGKDQLQIFGGEHKEFIELSIDTMRKYQKIVQIIEDWERDKGWALEMSELYWLDRVKEVIEDEAD